MHRTAPLLGLCLGITLQAGCLPKPKQDYSNEQLTQLTSLEEIMRVQAQTMDPLFAKRGQSSFTAEEFASIVDAGRRLQVTSSIVRDKFAKRYTRTTP